MEGNREREGVGVERNRGNFKQSKKTVSRTEGVESIAEWPRVRERKYQWYTQHKNAGAKRKQREKRGCGGENVYKYPRREQNAGRKRNTFLEEIV